MLVSPMLRMLNTSFGVCCINVCQQDVQTCTKAKASMLALPPSMHAVHPVQMSNIEISSYRWLR